MKKHSSIVSFPFTLLIVLTLLAQGFTVPSKAAAEAPPGVPQIILSEEMISLESGSGNPKLLVDEQEADRPDTSQSSDHHWAGTGVALLDLGGPYRIERIELFVKHGQPPNKEGLIVEYGKPGKWNQEHQFTQTGFYLNWESHDTDITTRYLHLTKVHGQTLGELRIYGNPISPDNLAPAPVTDLNASTVSAAVYLSWSAPGNDGMVGLAATYDIRYSLLPVTEDNWEQATTVPGVPVPLPPGTSQSMLIDGLLEDTMYYFAMKTSDDWDYYDEPNVSALSNVASVKTNPDTYPPATISDLQAPIIGSRTLTLSWKAPGDNGDTGIATQYDLRYSEAPITTPLQWADATVVTNLPAPQTAGSAESFEVAGLSPDTDYYFALVTIDEAGNASDLSNLLHLRTAEPDQTPPGEIDSLEVTVPQIAASRAILSWEAPGNDGDQGTATYYEVRYSTAPIDESNWEQAIPLDGAPTPLLANSAQSMEVVGLPTGIYYYVAIKTWDQDNNSSGISNVEKFGFARKIPLQPSMVINETGQGNAGALVDEQHIAIDPANGNGGDSETYWKNGGSRWTGFPNWLTSQSAVIDLGTTYELTDIYMYDFTHTGTIHGFTGEPGNWTQRFSDPQESYLSWNKHALNTESRYVRIQTESSVVPLEIAIYGIAIGSAEVPEPEQTRYALMQDFIGLNGFIDDPLDKLAVAGTVREYHPWRWDETDLENYPHNVKAFAPSNAGGGAWNFDSYYGSLKEMGIDVFPALKESHKMFNSHLEAKPVMPGDDPEDPASYAIHADHLFQFAARYGSTVVEDEWLRLKEDQPRVSGLNYIRYYEDANEQNMNWGGRTPYFTPYEYAAMASADYDGHRGQMGSSFGVKNADPNAKFVMGGLAGLDLDYIKAMKLWADYYRDGDFPADVLNVHHYSNTAGSQVGGTVGISPEADDLKGKAEALVDYRNRYLPDKELWVSEIGYDTHPNSTQRAPAIGSFSQEEVQAQWLIRAYLALAAAGIDRVQMYMLRDVNPDDATKYSTSGLTSSQATGHVPKSSWYYTYTLKNRLGDKRFVKEMPSGNPKVNIYLFESDQGEKAYVLWSPTAEQAQVDEYLFAPEGDVNTITQVTLEKGYTNGVTAYLPVEDGHAVVQVTERPVILLEGQIAEPGAPYWAEGSSLGYGERTLTTVELTWPAAAGDSDVMYYKLYNGEQFLVTVPSSIHSYTAAGLLEGQVYDFRIVAGDVTGKESAQALSAAIKQPDQTAPTQPGAVSAPLVTSSQVLLFWQASQDNVGVTQYRIYRDGSQLAGTAAGDATLYTVSGLRANSTYSFTITAVDEEGNESDPSEPLTVKTAAAASFGGSPAAPVAPPIAEEEPPQGSHVLLTEMEDDTYTVTEEQWAAALKAAIEDRENSAIQLVIPATSNEASYRISGSRWGALQERWPDGEVAFKWDNVTYILPVSLIDLKQLSEELGVSVENVNVHMEIKRPEWTQYMQLAEKVGSEGGFLLSEGLEFELWMESADGAEHLVDHFGNTYVTRIIVLKQPIPPGEATAVRWDPATGAIQFVPATFEVTPAGVTVTLKSNSNSLYAIVGMKRSFTDISASYAKHDIELLASKWIIHGKSDQRFDPKGQLTRAEFAALLSRAFLLSSSAVTPNPFGDVPAGAWYAESVAAASEAGWIVGDKGLFRPNDAVTMQEAAQIIHNILMRFPDAGGHGAANHDHLQNYRDADKVSAWAADAMNTLIDMQIIEGDGHNELHPDQAVTRERSAVLVRKLLQRVAFID